MIDTLARLLRKLPDVEVAAILPRRPGLLLAERLLAEDSVASTASSALVADEAAGHPLFIDALVRHSAIRGAAGRSARLSDALWARIAELDPAARQLLVMIAVAGWPLSHDILVAEAGLPADAIDPALARLRQARLVRATDGTGAGIEPYHDRVREAVLEHLDTELRKACHRALARMIDEADAWLTAQGVGSPERFARLYMPGVT